MLLNVRGLKGSYALEVTSEASLHDVRTLVAKEEGVLVDEILLYASGRPLDDVDPKSLDGLTLDVTSRLKGGKVHGSLARAGKVRGQTPKVEPQEKKKKKTGRAKRRIQYNRRFVNVVATFGRKRGPNANS